MESDHADRVVHALVKLVADYRKAKGLTYEELADRSGIHRTTIALWERNERSPTVHLALQLAGGLGLELSELLSRAEAIAIGNAPKTFKAVKGRLVERTNFFNEPDLRALTGLDHDCLRRALQGTYETLDTIDFQLQAHGSPPVGKLVELANLSSMLGNLIGGQIAECASGLYRRNRPHAYPDLLPIPPHDRNVEIKIALETNLPKGHLPKSGTYLTFRYVLCTKLGEFTRGKAGRGDTAFVWEGRVGDLEERDFAFSSTAGDSGKTAVIRTSAFERMKIFYYAKEFLPYAARRGVRYPCHESLL